MRREFLKPFAIERGDTLRIPAEFSAAGILKLQVIQGGAVYGFRGGVDKETAERRTSVTEEDKANVDFDLAANSSEPCTIILERDIGEITLYRPDDAENDSIGFLQFLEC